MIARRIELQLDQTIRELLEPYRIRLSDSQVAALRRYLGLLQAWNQRVNLTSITDPAEIITRHFGESFFATSVLPMLHGRLADVGSGAGFPGLALKILRPELNVILIEARTRRVAFLLEVIRNLDLTGVQVERQRLESVSLEMLEFVTARAVGQLDMVLRWAKGAMAANGRVILWLGDQEAGRLAANKEWNWLPAVLIPGSRRRVILVGQPKAS